MMRLLPLVLLVPTLLLAQASDGGNTDTIFVRAQRMVAEGQGDAGRALVQQQLDAAPAGSPKYVEALYWRAALASTAADAERDLKRIVIEYALSPRADDALMRLAQLEMARGDRDQALAHLQRVVTEHPSSASRARASYWMARTLFEQKKEVLGCTRLADARSNAATGDVELRNQIDYYAPRCEGVDTASAVNAASGPLPAATPAAVATPAPTASAPAPAANTPPVTPPATSPVTQEVTPPPGAPAPESSSPSASPTPTMTTSEPPPQLSVPTPAHPDAPASMPRKSEPVTPPPAAAPRVATPVSTPAATPAATRAAPSHTPSRTSPSAPAKAPVPTPAKTSSPTTGAAAYTVQLGAYNTHAEAVALQARLRTRGFETRVFGTQKPFRVRLGRYPTQAAANAEATKLKASKIDCFVTEAEAP